MNAPTPTLADLSSDADVDVDADDVDVEESREHFLDRFDHPVFTASRVAVSALGRRSRARRMHRFIERLHVGRGTRILDLGGRPEIWESVEGPLDITILNLPGETGADVQSRHNVTYVEGDATHVERPSGSFDLVFSNSVIEHVGPAEKQGAFAAEVKRLAAAYWVQTPVKWFPIEAHTGMPFWWFYPAAIRRAFIARWHKGLPDWAEAMEGTRVLERAFLEGLFPGAHVFTETLVGVPKSVAVWRAA